MIKIESFITVSKEKVIKKILNELEKASVYVGIPEENSERESGEVTNAQLLALHSKGSPLKNIPARPVIEPAIEASDNKAKISASLAKAAIKSLDGDQDGFITQLEKTGLTAQNICKGWFTDSRNGWPPNQPATVKAKLRKLKGKKKKEAIIEFNKRFFSGESMEGLDTPLIDTAQMRNAITYVVKKND